MHFCIFSFCCLFYFLFLILILILLFYFIILLFYYFILFFLFLFFIIYSLFFILIYSFLHFCIFSFVSDLLRQLAQFGVKVETFLQVSGCRVMYYMKVIFNILVSQIFLFFSTPIFPQLSSFLLLNSILFNLFFSSHPVSLCRCKIDFTPMLYPLLIILFRK